MLSKLKIPMDVKTSKLDLLIQYIFDPPIIFFQYCCVHHIRYDLDIKKKCFKKKQKNTDFSENFNTSEE